MSAPRPPQDRLTACVPRVSESALSRGASLTSLTAPGPVVGARLRTRGPWPL